MENPYNKPRVFLSHSVKDDEFVSRVANDLRRCHIEPWHYKYEIRHGKPWLDEIFNLAMPTCDAVIVYLTDASLSSQVVSKEIDVGILQQLSDKNVAFLPYVNDEKIRSQLRADIRALQIPEWNNDNYSSMLPVVVSEIWRSYLERTVTLAVKDEHLKRVEAELELEKYKSQPEDVFSASETKEFEFIWSSFNRTIPFHLEVNIEDEDGYVTCNFILHLSTVVSLLSDFLPIEFEKYNVRSNLFDKVREFVRVGREFIGADLYSQWGFPEFDDFTNELITYGLVEKFTLKGNTMGMEYGSDYVEHKLVLSKKYFRYRYWLAYHQKMPEKVQVERVGDCQK